MGNFRRCGSNGPPHQHEEQHDGWSPSYYPPVSSSAPRPQPPRHLAQLQAAAGFVEHTCAKLRCWTGRREPVGQHPHHFSVLIGHRSAGGTLRHMVLDLRPRFRIHVAEHVLGKVLLELLMDVIHRASSSSATGSKYGRSAVRSRSNAVRVRVLIVPNGSPRCCAISPCVKPP
jgi:hypothetical protein